MVHNSDVFFQVSRRRHTYTTCRPLAFVWIFFFFRDAFELEKVDEKDELFLIYFHVSVAMVCVVWKPQYGRQRIVIYDVCYYRN